jgi:hypothetical protein
VRTMAESNGLDGMGATRQGGLDASNSNRSLTLREWPSNAAAMSRRSQVLSASLISVAPLRLRGACSPYSSLRRPLSSDLSSVTSSSKRSKSSAAVVRVSSMGHGGRLLEGQPGRQ